MGRAFAVVVMLLAGLAAAAQNAPLQGSVTENNTVPVPTDEFASGDACNAPTGILIAPCTTLQNYLNDGGKDAACVQMLQQAIAAAQDEIQLMDAAQKAGGFQGTTYQQYVADGSKLNTLVSNFEIQCLPIPRNTGGSGAPPAQPNPAQPSSDFTNELLGDAQTLLQNAGRISKAMTDAMDVTKHNNVGIGVAFGATFGAAFKMLGIAAQQYQALATAGRVAADDSAILQIAGDAASESGTLADQATQTAAKLGTGATMGTVPGAAGYLEGAEIDAAASTGAIAQGELPTCALLGCNRLAQLLGRNISIMRIYDQIQPKINLAISATGEVSVSGGLTAQEVVDALKVLNINAQVGTGLSNLQSEIAAGRPVIAGVYTMGVGNSPLHALVIESAETRAGVAGFNIYDPAGSFYWQPVATFSKYFTNEFVKAI